MKAISEDPVSPDGQIEEFLQKYEKRELLRFLTCGSVDDGKSTLIGRLLHDSQMVYDDQLAAVRRDTVRHGTTGEEIDFALLVDGLEAEREQGITIDVAYRYFSTPRRKFIIADTPGHEQYTRNMATGASTCNLAVILVDARKGVLDQTRRHSFIASLLGIRHLVVAINKMDLVDYSQERFESIRADFSDFAAKLQVTDIEFIPMSALRGDNVVHRSDRMPWYLGRPLLDHLDTVHIASDVNLIDLRLPVQMAVRPNLDFRGYAGTITSGVLRKGDEIVALPSARTSTVRQLFSAGREVPEAFAPMAVVITLDDELDLSRGDMVAHVQNVPQVGQDLEAMLVWMNDRPLQPGREYLLKQATTEVPAIVDRVRYRMNVNTLRREETATLGLNEIGRVRLETARQLAFDPYVKNHGTGGFILIDRVTNATLAAGMILDREVGEGEAIVPKAASASGSLSGVILWLTGSVRDHQEELARSVVRLLNARGRHARELSAGVLDRLMSDLGSAAQGTGEYSRRTLEVARILAAAGVDVVVSAPGAPTDAGADPRVAVIDAAEEALDAESVLRHVHRILGAEY